MKNRKEVVDFLNVALLAAGESMRSASLKLGLNHSYLSQFMRTDDYSPEELPEGVRKDLARLLNTSEENLRVRSEKPDSVNHVESPSTYGGTVEGTDSTTRMTMEMRHIYEELGRIKERLDRLEKQVAEQGTTIKGTTSSNP